MSLFITRHNRPILISAAVALGVIALSNDFDLLNSLNWLIAIFVFFSSFLALLVLDFDYYLYVRFVDPEDPHRKPVSECKSYSAYFQYVCENEYKFDGVVFRSAIFLLLLTIMAYYVVITNSALFVQAFVISLLGNLIYVLIMEYQSTKSLKRWFWFSDDELPKGVYITVFTVFTFLFVYLFTLI